MRGSRREQSTELGEIQRSGGLHSIGTRRGGPRLALEVTHDGRRDVAARERSDVGGLGAVQEVAGREHAGPRWCAARRSTDRAARARVELELPPRTASSWSGIQSAVKTTVSHSSSRTAPLSRSRELDRLDPPPAADRAHRGAGEQRAPGTRSAAPARRRRATGGGGCSVTIATARAPPCARVSTAEKLTCSAPTTTARAPGALAAAGRRAAAACPSSSRPAAASRAPAAPSAGARGSRWPARRRAASSGARPAGPVSSRRAVLGPACHLGSPSGPRRRRRAARAAIASARSAARHQDAAQVAQAEARCGRGAGCRPARLALEHHAPGRRPHRAARPPPRARRDRRRRRHVRASPGGSALTAAARAAGGVAAGVLGEQRANLRPRRRSPGSGPSAPGCAGAGRRGRPGASGSPAASRISPRVTRSQKHTIRPYSGSSAIRSALRVGPGDGLADVGHPRRGEAARTLGAARARRRRAGRATCSAIAIDAGEPGRADAADADVAAARASTRDLVVGVLGGRAQPGVDRGHLLGEQRGHDPPPFGRRRRGPSRSTRSPSLSLDVLGGRAEHHVAEDRRRDEHALGRRRSAPAGGCGARAGGASLSKTISSPRRGRDREPVVAEHRGRPRRERRPGGVDDPARRELAARGPQASARRSRRRRRPVTAVPSSAARRRPSTASVAKASGVRQGADDALVRHLERAQRPGPEVRLARVELVAGRRRGSSS